LLSIENEKKFYQKINQNYDHIKLQKNEKIEEIIKKIENYEHIIMDSLSSLILRYGVEDVIFLINSLLDEKKTILGILHSDMHEKMELEKVIYQNDAIIKIKNKSNEREYEFEIFSKREKNKLIKNIECYKLENFDLELLVNENNEFSSNGNDTKKEVQLSFKLSLSEKEKNEKDKLILPFHKNSNDIEDMIEYDSEDPDDDLEI
jgi:hypothetical protein